jgi:hypothetical protein
MTLSVQQPSSQNDFVIREGFPALRTKGGKEPWIDGDEPIPRFSFWAQRNAIEFENLESWWQQDCKTVFTARAKDEQEAYSAGTTYFVPSQMKPRCALEALALQIFDKHTVFLDNGVMIPEQSGAEWWTLVLDEDEAMATKSSEDKKQEEEDESDEVGLHFDADYGLEDQAPNLLLHPRLATVTYLSNFGAPTVVLDKRSPPPNDPEKTTLNGDISRGWLSQPTRGKHMAFDGRLLHGAPATFFPARFFNQPVSEPPLKKVKQERVRITFLVNIWINHCPLDAEPLEESVIEKLVTPFKESAAFTWTSELLLDQSTPCTTIPLKANASDPAGEEEFVLCSHLVTAKYGASMDDFHASCQVDDDLIELELGTGVMTLQVGGQVQDDDDDDDDESDDPDESIESNH